jgi:Mg-chelatase subunit ChlD
MQEAMALIASAVARRRLEVVFGSEPATYTDGQRLWLPEAEAPVAPACAQAGLLAIGSLRPQLMARLVGRRSATARYAVLETGRMARALEHVLPPVALHAFNGLGVERVPASAEESLERALSGEHVAIAPAIVGVIRPSLVLLARSTGEDEGSPSAVQKGQIKDVSAQLTEADDDESDATRDLLASVFSKNPLSKLVGKLFGDEMTSGGGAREDSGPELAAGGAHRVQRMSGRGRFAEIVGHAVSGDGFGVSGTAYPEWDFGRLRYRLDHCTVHHLDPDPGNFDGSVQQGYDPVLRRAVARLGLSLQRQRRLADGDGLDLRALVDFSVARAAGFDPDSRVYESRRPTGRDLGVVLLLDASGSTRDAREQGGEIWNEQRSVAMRLADAFEQAGDQIAVYAFRSMGRHDARFLRIKNFEDRFDRSARRRLGELEPSGYTRLGVAIRHAAALARDQSGVGRQLLVVISDGLPYEDDYRGRYAENDVKRALAEAVAAGVGCVCISVGSAQDEATLERIWGAVSHLHLDDSRELARQGETLIRAALHEAVRASHGDRGSSVRDQELQEMNA